MGDIGEVAGEVKYSPIALNIKKYYHMYDLEKTTLNQHATHKVLGVGTYSVLEASRLLKIPTVNVRRWLGGYSFKNVKSDKTVMPPLWKSELPLYGNHLEIGFRDLIELKFVREFMKAGLSVNVIRLCLDKAAQVIADSHPFSTRRFQTDGSTIFFEGIKGSGHAELLDLKKSQYALPEIIKQTFKDLDIEDDVVASWRPYKGKKSILIDPNRSFGQPIAADAGVPTIVLAQAVQAEGSIAAVARLYEVAPTVVRDAIAFEGLLEAA